MSESQSPEAMAQEAKRLRVLISGLQAAQSRLFLKERIAHIEAAIRRLDATIDALAALAGAGQKNCMHRIADARNRYVQSGYACINCGALFQAADHSLATQPKDTE